MAETDSPTFIDATGEPLMDEQHFDVMTSQADFAPRALPSYPSFSDSTTQNAVDARDSKMSMKKALDHAKHASTSSTIYTIPPSPGVQDESPIGSISAASTAPTSYSALPMLQTKGPPNGTDQLAQVNVDDPNNFDLLESVPDESQAVYELETRVQLLFSAEHLHMIFKDPKLLLQFTGFLNSHRPSSLRTLNYYMDALKAIRAINYANAVARSLTSLHEYNQPPLETVNNELIERAERAFQDLARDDLPAWITYNWTKIASVSIQRRVTGTLAPHLREASEGLAEVFCLSDPSRPDTPIVFASEEFQRTTQYGLTYCVGRNCRFLQGSRTNKSSVERLAKAVKAGKEHSEVFLNYRRDGSPFMNLLMMAPLVDAQGKIRYFIGAQIDVSGLVKESTGLEGLQRLIARQEDAALAAEQDKEDDKKDEFQRLSEIMNNHELETVRKYGGKLHQAHIDGEIDDGASMASHRPRLLLTDPTSEELDQRTRAMPAAQAAATRADIVANGRLQGVYQNYLLVRPAPTLRILFTSPSLRIPGILQSSLTSRIGGSSRVRKELAHAFEEGRGVTAKVKWLTRPRDERGDSTTYTEEGRSRWLHCTPLLGHTGKIGVWMVVIVDEETHPGESQRRFRVAPPVAAQIQSRDADRAIFDSDVVPGIRSKRSTASSAKYPSGSLDALRSHPVSPTQSEFPSSQRDSKTSSLYNVLRGKSYTQESKAAAPAETNAPRSRPQSELSFALR